MSKIKLESLQIKDHSFDHKIDALNILATVKVQDYLDIANSIKNNNELQRRRVSNPSTVYSLLKEDLIAGCIIPSIVLALDGEEESPNIEEINYTLIGDKIKDKAEDLKIIDGLQRTNILLDLSNELKETKEKTFEELQDDRAKLESLLNSQLRIELYINISRFGILYRMLTLNTGQTPMSLRHQIEILYSDYYINEKEGIQLLRDAFDVKKTVKIGQYKFSDIVEGVTSFIDGSEFTLDRFDLLSYTKSLKKLSNTDTRTDIFTSYVTLYDLLIREISKKANGWQFNPENLSQENLTYFPVQKTDLNTGKEIRTNPFGNTAEDIFLKSQIFTGLGAALNILKEKSIISEFSDLDDLIKNIKFDVSPNNAFDNLIVRLEQIRKDSKKIGESQRTFFKFFFVSLFNSFDSDSVTLFDAATESAFRKTI